MSTNQAKIQELFRDTLLSDEEIYWIGEPLHNYWHFRGRYLFYIFGLVLLIPVVLLIIYALVIGISVAQALISLMTTEVLAVAAYWTFILVLRIVTRPLREKKQFGETKAHEAHKSVLWWKPSYYAITNLRVLIFEQGSIRDYWYHLLDAPILKKPKNRTASIDLYSSTYAAKKKKTPVLDSLRGIDEDEADDVFALLKQAREEALDERKDKMGLE
jgi:uncharacterized membrane protein YhaH (DUF805 family)